MAKSEHKTSAESVPRKTEFGIERFHSRCVGLLSVFPVPRRTVFLQRIVMVNLSLFFYGYPIMVRLPGNNDACDEQ